MVFFSFVEFYSSENDDTRYNKTSKRIRWEDKFDIKTLDSAEKTKETYKCNEKSSQNKNMKPIIDVDTLSKDIKKVINDNHKNKVDPKTDNLSNSDENDDQTLLDLLSSGDESFTEFKIDKNKSYLKINREENDTNSNDKDKKESESEKSEVPEISSTSKPHNNKRKDESSKHKEQTGSKTNTTEKKPSESPKRDEQAIPSTSKQQENDKNVSKSPKRTEPVNSSTDKPEPQKNSDKTKERIDPIIKKGKPKTKKKILPANVARYCKEQTQEVKQARKLQDVGLNFPPDVVNFHLKDPRKGKTVPKTNQSKKNEEDMISKLNRIVNELDVKETKLKNDLQQTLENGKGKKPEEEHPPSPKIDKKGWFLFQIYPLSSLICFDFYFKSLTKNPTTTTTLQMMTSKSTV